MSYCLHKINPNVINNITMYRGELDNQIISLFQQLLNSNNGNFFNTPQARLYFLISENMRMNICYLSSLWVEFDAFNFIGVQRNLRSSIEAYYDLHNLVNGGNDYYVLLEYFHYKSDNNLDENFYKANHFTQLGKYRRYLNYKFLSMQNKATIAEEMYSLNMRALDYYKTITSDFNSYVHADIFTISKQIQDKETQIRNLIFTDCNLLADAFHELVTYCNSLNINYQFDPFIGLDRLIRTQYPYPYITPIY